MAVEIPVVVDIDQAFEDAAKRVPKAAKPLEEQVEQVNRRISSAIQKMQKAAVNPSVGAEELDKKMSKYANTVRLATLQMRKLGEAQGKLVSGRLDIQDISTRLVNLVNNWNSMKLGSKFDPDGQLRVKAQGIISQMSTLTGRTIKFGNSLTETSAKATKAASKVSAKIKETNADLSAQSGILAKLSKYVSGYMALFAGVRFIRNVREVTSEFELQRVALGSIIRDTERAEGLFKQIKAAAVESPFEIKDLVSYTKQLSAYQIETEKLFDTTMKLADVSAGLGVDMGRLILAFGQVRAAAVLRGQELRQFTEAGIPLVDKLAQKFSELNGRAVTTAEVFELISKRAVPFSMIEEIFDDMTSAGGMFYKMQEKQAETLLGQWNNLKDAVSIMYDEIGNTDVAHGAMEALIRDARVIMQNWRQVADAVKFAGAQFAIMKIASMFVPKLAMDTKLLDKAEQSYARSKKLSTAATASGNKVMVLSSKLYRQYAYYTIQAARATTGWGRALNTLKGFLSGNWMAIAVTAITLIASKLYAAWKEAGRLNKELANIANDGAVQVDRSVRNFERLAKTAVQAADGTKEQKDAVDELTRVYGDMLPPSDKVIDKLKEMEGNYTSLTDAIRQKINMQIREQQVDEITANYGKKIGAERDTIKKYLKARGLSSEEISAVSEQLQNAVEQGLIGVGQGVEEQAKAIEEIIYNYTGKYVKLTRSVYDRIAGEGARQVYRGEAATSISKSFSSLVKLYTNMNDAIKNVDDQMEGSIGVMGVYRDEWKKLQEDLGRFEGIGDTKFAKNESKIKNTVERSIAFLQEKFNEAQIDISSAIVNGTPKFDILESAVSEMKSGPAQASLRSIIRDFQKQYEKIVPSDQITDAIKAKMIEASETTGISMDKLTSYIKKAGEDGSKWLKELGESIESYRKDAQQVVDLMANVAIANTDDNKKLVAEYNGMADALQIVYDAMSRIIKLDAGGSGGGDRLKGLRDSISEITNAYKKFLELTKYMSSQSALANIDKFFPSLSGWEPTYENMLDRLGELMTKYRGDADATLLIEQAIANIKFDKVKSDMEDALQRLSDEIKRSETARNFYKNILDMTGDEELAANMTVSVYGDVGKEFKDRMQQQLDAAFQSLDWSELPDDVFGQLAVAVSNQDFNAILDKLELFPEEWQKVLKQMASDNEKYNADYLSNLYKTYQKAKTFDERRRDVRNREAQKRAEIEANTSLTDEQKAEFTAASRTKEAKDLAKINVEELKNTYEWTNAFEDLDRVGSVTLVNLREKIEAIIEAQKDILTPEDLKALTEALTKIRDTQTQRDPITAFASSGRKAALLAPAVFSKQGSKAYDKAIEKIKKFNEQAKETDKIDLDHLQDAFTASVDDIEKGAEAVANYASQWKGVIDTISDVFELDEIPILGETIDGVSSALGVVAAIIPVITVETTALSAAANSIPFVAILTAIVATLGAIIGMIKGIINAKVERLNQKIETQKEYVNDLERAYDRLGKAIEKSFGTDYIENYRKSLENLAAQQAAYQEQARLEREKGKKSDEKKAREYEEAAVDVAEKIDDAQGQIAEFFAGTDLTSAAKDFASAWLDAYREFGSITTAMKEKFQDMLGEMVENAMFAQLAQTILRPFYDEINRRADDGQLSAKDVADIASMVPDYIESLNGAFTVAANQLQAYGYNLRETAGTMTGISRSIAGASEESINSLAAGINTQNFYVQHIDANVALILSSLTGGATTAGASVTGEVVDPYKDVMLKNVAFIPTIDRNLSELLAEVRKVIKPRDAARSSSHVLVTNL